jgi:hypothetical protein
MRPLRHERVLDIPDDVRWLTAHRSIISHAADLVGDNAGDAL